VPENRKTTAEDPLARRLAEACTLRGSFTLRSGATSDRYFDKYLFASDPSLLSEVAKRLAPLIPDGAQVLGGLELGGVPVATALSLASGLPVAFVRKEAKNYGTARLAEGAPVSGRRLVIIEDVVTTGGQVAQSARELADRGSLVDTALCVLDRSDGHHGPLEDAGITLVSLFTAAELGW
jgi:orotate phosphoribosyltransferase